MNQLSRACFALVHVRDQGATATGTSPSFNGSPGGMLAFVANEDNESHDIVIASQPTCRSPIGCKARGYPGPQAVFVIALERRLLVARAYACALTLVCVPTATKRGSIETDRALAETYEAEGEQRAILQSQDTSTIFFRSPS